MRPAIYMVFALLVLVLFTPHNVQAGCKSDCGDNYQTAKEDCLLLHADPDEADDFSMCLDDAKSDYENCIAECES